ncbi:MAG: response regulator [Mariprofundus sp.]|nr:response regulator [Mariprofundus sp.]
MQLKRILYADDELDLQQVATIALEMVGGFTLKICNSGLEAVAAYEAFAPQLMLFDVMMPDLGGPEAFEKIKRLSVYQQTPIIFMTAKNKPAEIQQYLNMGALAVIAKPFDPMSLASELQTIWENREV